MKQILLAFSFLLFLTVAHGQANVYHPFPDTDAVWTVFDQMSHTGTHCDNDEWMRSYIQKGDTIINSKLYNKLYLNEDHSESNGPPPPCSYSYPITTNLFIGGLRNDSLNKKVFFYDNSKNQECLLYNFNVNIGDTIQDWLAYCSASTIYWKITSIDSALVGSKYHKRFNINGGINADTSIIEGIGSLTGLLGPYAFFENFNHLICNSVLGQTMFVNKGPPASCGIVGIGETKDNAPYSIYPNPFYTETTLRTKNIFKNVSLTLYNSLGQAVKQMNNLTGQEIILQRENLPSGLYFLRLMEDNKVLATNKLVITD